MTLISIGRVQRLLASFSKAALMWVFDSRAHCPFMQVYYQFLSFFFLLSSLYPFWLVYPMQIRLPSTVKTHSYSIPTHYGHILWGQRCPSASLVAIPTCCQPAQVTKWVVSTGAGELPLCILPAWRGWIAGSAKSSTKKTLFPLSYPIGRKLAGQLFLHEVHVTLMPRPSWHCWLARLAVAPLCGILEDRIGLVPPGYDILGQQMAL